MGGVNHFCFGLSYILVMILEIVRSLHNGIWIRIVVRFFTLAGIGAHTIFLWIHQPSLATSYGSLLLLGWVFAIFYSYGQLKSKPYPWNFFVLPLVIFFVFGSYLSWQEIEKDHESWFAGQHFWGMVHGGLILAASVGITLGTLASIMYLLQDYRLRQKRNPISGLKLLSLERLETINRRAISSAFIFLTIGLLLGIMLIRFSSADVLGTEWKILGTIGLWLLALLLLYLHSGDHLPASRVAYLTLLAFSLLLATLVASHPYLQGGTTP